MFRTGFDFEGVAGQLDVFRSVLQRTSGKALSFFGEKQDWQPSNMKIAIEETDVYLNAIKYGFISVLSAVVSLGLSMIAGVFAGLFLFAFSVSMISSLLFTGMSVYMSIIHILDRLGRL